MLSIGASKINRYFPEKSGQKVPEKHKSRKFPVTLASESIETLAPL